jgi:hypothetical protein
MSEPDYVTERSRKQDFDNYPDNVTTRFHYTVETTTTHATANATSHYVDEQTSDEGRFSTHDVDSDDNYPRMTNHVTTHECNSESESTTSTTSPQDPRDTKTPRYNRITSLQFHFLPTTTNDTSTTFYTFDDDDDDAHDNYVGQATLDYHERRETQTTTTTTDVNENNATPLQRNYKQNEDDAQRDEFNIKSREDYVPQNVHEGMTCDHTTPLHDHKTINYGTLLDHVLTNYVCTRLQDDVGLHAAELQLPKGHLPAVELPDSKGMKDMTTALTLTLTQSVRTTSCTTSSRRRGHYSQRSSRRAVEGTTTSSNFALQAAALLGRATSRTPSQCSTTQRRSE